MAIRESVTGNRENLYLVTCNCKVSNRLTANGLTGNCQLVTQPGGQKTENDTGSCIQHEVH